jgi:hypothetical protein
MTTTETSGQGGSGRRRPGAARPAWRTGAGSAPAVEDLLKALASYVGQTAYITADLEKIIGRPATSYGRRAVQHADAYR